MDVRYRLTNLFIQGSSQTRGRQKEEKKRRTGEKKNTEEKKRKRKEGEEKRGTKENSTGLSANQVFLLHPYFIFHGFSNVFI